MVLGDISAWIEWLILTIVKPEPAKWPTREIGADKVDPVVAFAQVCGAE